MRYVKIGKNGLTGVVLEEQGDNVLVRVMNPMWPFPKEQWMRSGDVCTTRGPRFVVDKQAEEVATW